jgi:UDP-N-acetylmuramoylalanine--D-glutamate ligase
VEPVRQRCVTCYLIGEAAERLATELEPSGIPLEPCETLERAINAASEAAKPGEVVLLSPACASFDQFKDFEERGDRFRELVEALG